MLFFYRPQTEVRGVRLTGNRKITVIQDVCPTHSGLKARVKIAYDLPEWRHDDPNEGSIVARSLPYLVELFAVS